MITLSAMRIWLSDTRVHRPRAVADNAAHKGWIIDKSIAVWLDSDTSKIWYD